MEIEQIKQIKETYQTNLFSKANVVGVAIGYKFINNVKTEDISVVVNVSNKVPLSELNSEDIIPSQLDGINTDVIQVGNLTVHIDPTQKFRPAPGGVSIGHKDITAGTLGIVVRKIEKPDIDPSESYACIGNTVLGWPKEYCDIKEVQYILSNNHVLAHGNHAQIGDEIYQPGPYDGGTANDIIATLYSFEPLKFGGQFNKVDCALAKPLSDSDVILNDILEIGIVEDSVEAYLGMEVRKYGRTTQLVNGEVIQIYATVAVGGYPDGEALFENQIITTNMSEGGDSGSLLVERNGQRAVGLLFAGSPSVTVHNRIADVEQALEIKI